MVATARRRAAALRGRARLPRPLNALRTTLANGEATQIHEPVLNSGAPAIAEVSRRVVLAYLAALNAADIDAAASLVTEDFVSEHTATLGEDVFGQENYREKLAGFFASFADASYKVEDLIADGNRVAVAYQFHATCKEPGSRLHPIAIRGMFRFTIIGSHISRRVDYWDTMRYMLQANTRATLRDAVLQMMARSGERR
ncbi:ester cyclase [Kribbella sp. NBC_00359]|uniref:ester cyclase n=1 Tax=Kribbella sp. NBC_00359 TaxID=2975966 RepID=UPI002E1C9D89